VTATDTRSIEQATRPQATGRHALDIRTLTAAAIVLIDSHLPDVNQPELWCRKRLRLPPPQGRPCHFCFEPWPCEPARWAANRVVIADGMCVTRVQAGSTSPRHRRSDDQPHDAEQPEVRRP
jgi:hypothetical protein